MRRVYKRSVMNCENTEIMFHIIYCNTTFCVTIFLLNYIDSEK